MQNTWACSGHRRAGCKLSATGAVWRPIVMELAVHWTPRVTSTVISGPLCGNWTKELPQCQEVCFPYCQTETNCTEHALLHSAYASFIITNGSPYDGKLFRIFRPLVFGCINADFFNRSIISHFYSTVLSLHSLHRSTVISFSKRIHVLRKIQRNFATKCRERSQIFCSSTKNFDV